MQKTTVNKNQLVVVQKYERFINYFYPVAQNIPRAHQVAKTMFIQDMLKQVNLFVIAGKTPNINKLYEADAGLATLKYWVRFLSDENRKIITHRQYELGSIMLSEVGALLGAWMSSRRDSKKV